MVIPSPYSLYFHIPFCKKKCDYCHFYVIPDRQSHQLLYMEALRKEWALRSPQLPHEKLISIYFGGGTPSLLNPNYIEEILSWISPSSQVEITLEINPENHATIDFKALKQIGINRVSLGAQSFDEQLLTHLSRTHVPSDVMATIDLLQQTNLTNISIDLMYDIPHQTLQSWDTTLQFATHLPITHLSLYNLTFEPHTVFYKKRELFKQHLVDPMISLQMLEMAVSHFEQSGLHRYEISAFGKPQFASLHNIGYWQGRPFLGFGPSAFSYWEGSRFCNCANLLRYAKALNDHLDPIDFRETLSPLEQTQELLAIGLRMLEGVPKHSWPQSLTHKLERLKKMEWITEKNNHICLTTQGLLYHDSVAEILVN